MVENVEALPTIASRVYTSVGEDLVLFPEGKLISSRAQLLQEVAQRGPTELFQDAASLVRDVSVGAREMVDLRRDAVYEGVGLPRGDRSPVGIIGGFGSSQIHYFDSAHSLSRANYSVRTMPWGMVNEKNPFDMAHFMMPEIKQFKKDSGQRIKLVVHSLGGYDAAAMFALYPQEFVDNVEHVVFVGSPRPERLNSALALSYLVLHMFERDDEFKMTEKLTELEDVVESGLIKVTSIDSSFDPVVRGQHLAKDENHYVIDRASHSALGMNRFTIRAVAHAFVGEEVDNMLHPTIHHPSKEAA